MQTLTHIRENTTTINTLIIIIIILSQYSRKILLNTISLEDAEEHVYSQFPF